jgi:dihydrofolate reductase
MRKLFLYMTTSLDGFVAGPNNELDWMQMSDQENNADVVALLNSSDTGLIGYPTGIGMVPYWASVANNPSASAGELAIAQAITRLHGILITHHEEKNVPPNSELLLVKSDQDLVNAVTRLKQQPGLNLGVPGGVRTGQTFARLGLVDEYVLMVHPVALGNGKRLFTAKTNLELVSTKTYKTGIMRLSYRPR